MTIKAEVALDSLYNFTQTQKVILDRLAKDLTDIKDKKISMDTLSTLTNSFRELDAMRENVITRLLSSLKRGDIVS